MITASNGRRGRSDPRSSLPGFPKRTTPLCPEYNPEISENQGTSDSLPRAQATLEGFAGVNKEMVCVSLECVKRVTLGTGPAELQPFGGVGGRAGTGVRQARCLAHKISGGTNSLHQASTVRPQSESLLKLCAMGATWWYNSARLTLRNSQF